MDLLHGIVAPPGDGIVLEVHLDLMDAPPAFQSRLKELGFDSDPFLEFYPQQYRFHHTGRTRATQRDIPDVLTNIRALTAQIILEAKQADVKMYAEIELVRNIQHFDNGSARGLAALDDIALRQTSPSRSAKADIHVEFCAGTVPLQVRSFLLAKKFYWVKTPSSERFPSEEIATIQTSTFHDASVVYSQLVARPLPACTGIHLEQKLAMVASHSNISMPETFEIAADTSPTP